MQERRYVVRLISIQNLNKFLEHRIHLQTYLEAAKAKCNRNYKAMSPNKITTTVGLNIGKIDIAGISLNFWDLGGQEELQSLWDKVNIIMFYPIRRFDTC